MTTIGKNTYYQNGSTSETGVDTPAHLINAYLHSQGMTTNDARKSFLAKYGLTKTDWNAINSNPQLSNKILADIGLSTPAQVNAFKGIYSEPASGITAEMREKGITTPLTSSTGGSYNPTPAAQMSDQQFEQLMNSSGLNDDQKLALKAIYDAASTHDEEKYNQLVAAFQSATKFSDPYFKAQSRLVLDSLDRAFQNVDGDLEYNETKLKNALQDLQRDITASSESLSFQEQQDLKALERSYEQQLDTTRNDMATRGFTQSSIRTRAEGYVNDSFGDLRESTKRSFRERHTTLNNQGSDAARNHALELQRLRELAARGKTDTKRQAENTLGSNALQNAGYNNLLGGIGGELPRQQNQDALSFANNFVF